MVDMEVVNNCQNDLELIINRWILDFYYSRGIEFFLNDKKEDFLSVKNIFESILKRPYEVASDTQIQIQLVKFLGEVNESDSSDVPFDQIDCLESALTLLEDVNHTYIIQQEDYNSVKTSLKELIVMILVKNGEFEKAEEMLKKHFPRPVVGKKSIFMGLIKKKSKSHHLIDQVDFQHCKQELVAFCQKICPMKLPLLCKVATQCIKKRLENPDETTADLDEAREPDEACEPDPSFDSEENTSAVLAPCELSTVTISRLEAVYRSLATDLHGKSFTQLKMEVTKEDLTLSLQKSTSQDAEQNVPYQEASCSPMEASPADQPAQVDADPQMQTGSDPETVSVSRKRQHYTVAQLVVEPDSQGSSQCTAASEEMEPEVGAGELTAAVASPAETRPKSPITEDKIVTPPRVRRRTRSSKARRLSNSEEVDSTSSPSTPEKTPKQAANDSVHQRSQITPPANQPPSQSQASGCCDEDGVNKVCIIDSSLDSSPSLSAALPDPQKSSTPHRNPQKQKHSESKWKRLFNDASESKETWDDDLFPNVKKGSRSRSDHDSSSTQRRRMWTEAETQKLVEGVKKFGEGNWTKIRSYYSFKDRTNVNLKDRWRTMKKSDMV